MSTTNTTLKIRAFNIKYDTDGLKIKLPSEMEFEVAADFDAENEIADLVSDKTGWCVYSCEWEYSKESPLSIQMGEILNEITLGKESYEPR